jgi:acyl-CoA thioesterase
VEDHFSNHLGFEVLAADGARVKIRGVVRPEYTNAAATAHGGFLYTLADAAFALAVNSGGREGPAVATHMEYFRPAREGEALTADATGVSVGKRLATYKVDVRRDTDGKLLASLTGTAYLTTEREKPENGD